MHDKATFDTERLKLQRDPESRELVLEVHHGFRGRKQTNIPLTGVMRAEARESFRGSGDGTITLHLDPMVFPRGRAELTVRKVTNAKHHAERIHHESAIARTSKLRAETVDTTIKAFDESLLAAPDHARERAQRGFAVAGAIAAGLTGLGAIADLGDASFIVQVVGAAALLFWVAAALVYLGAVTFAKPDALVNWDERGAVVSRLIDGVRVELSKIERRARLGRRLTVGAVLVTVAAVGFSFQDARSADEAEPEIVYLRDSGVALLSRLCNRLSTTEQAVGKVRFEEDLVLITFEPGKCRSEEINVRVARASFLGTAER